MYVQGTSTFIFITYIVPMHVQCMVCVYVTISKRKIVVNNYDNEILRILIKNV